MNSQPRFREPAWRNPRLPRSKMPPARLRPWLMDDSSLTRQLKDLCGAEFRVDVVSERRARPSLSEAKQLSVPPWRLARVREVYLCCGARRWVFARTVIPFSTLRGTNRRLASLGSKPLGAFLFAQPHLRRGSLQSTWRGDLGKEGVFGRRSLFFLKQRALLVSEFFLPEFVELIST